MITAATSWPDVANFAIFTLFILGFMWICRRG